MYSNLTQNHAAHLEAEVMRHNGEVDAADARRFILHVLYGSYPHIQLNNLPIDLKLNLADAIASDKSEPSSIVFLNELYQSFGFNRIIVGRAQEEVINFFNPENLEAIGKNWSSRGDFTALLQSMTTNGSAYSAEEKREVLQFMSDAYNDYLGAPRTMIHLVSRNPHLKGYYEPETGSVYVNANTFEFQNDFSKLINVIFHENKHNSDFHLSRKPSNTYARLMNINTRGYINAEALGYESYRFQPLEVTAHAAGEAAEAMTKTLAAANDDAPLPPEERPGQPHYIILIAA